MLAKILYASLLLLPFAQPSMAASMPVQPVVAALQSAAQPSQVNLNTASAEQLAMGLTGVGLKRAEAIVALRTELGGFTDINQLLQVKGIGPRMLELNRERLTL